MHARIWNKYHVNIIIKKIRYKKIPAIENIDILIKVFEMGNLDLKLIVKIFLQMVSIIIQKF